MSVNTFYFQQNFAVEEIPKSNDSIKRTYIDYISFDSKILYKFSIRRKPLL